MPMYAPRAASMPQFIEAPYPEFGLSTMTMRSSFRAHSCKTDSDPSVDPSLTATISKSRSVCEHSASRHCGK